MIEIDPAIAAIDAYLKAHPDAAVLEHWRQLRGYITMLDEQRHIYLAIGIALEILFAIVVGVIGGTHP